MILLDSSLEDAQNTSSIGTSCNIEWIRHEFEVSSKVTGIGWISVVTTDTSKFCGDDDKAIAEGEDNGTPVSGSWAIGGYIIS